METYFLLRYLNISISLLIKVTFNVHNNINTILFGIMFKHASNWYSRQVKFKSHNLYQRNTT